MTRYRPLVVLFALASLLFPSWTLTRAAPDEDDASAADPKALLRTGEYQRAIDGFKARAEKDPADAASRRGWAEALEATGRYDEALQALTQAPGFDKSPVLLNSSGRVHLRVGRLAEAEKAFQAAAELSAGINRAANLGARIEALNRLGEVYRWTGRRSEAEAKWNEVIGIYEDLSGDEAKALPADSYVEMALACVGLNRYHDANEVMFDQAEEQDKDCPALNLEWGRVLLQKYNFPNSRDSLRQATKQNPRFADAQVLMAENYLTDFQVGTERYKLAEEQIQRALDVNPRHPGAFTARGRLWLSDGNLPRAIADFKTALEINPALLRTRGLLAAAYFLASEREAFAAEETKALDVNPKAAEFYHTIAEAIEMRFRYTDAARMSERALALDPDYWPAFHTLGINLLRLGDDKRARQFLDKSFKNDPFNVWVDNTRKLLRHMDKNHQTVEHGPFRFKLPKEDLDVLMTFLVPLLEEAYEKLQAHYRLQLEPPVFVEVFSGHQWFSARIVGLGGFPATGACFGNLVALTTPKALPQNWGAVAWHEFAHVVTLHATHHRVPRWLTEGLSVFEEGRDHPRWERLFDREVADAYGAGRLLPLRELDFGFSKPKWPGQVLMSYYQGCMIVKYITGRWGFDKVLEVLKGYDANQRTEDIFRAVCGESLEEFDRGFFAYLNAWVQANGYEPELGEEQVKKLQLEVEEKPGDPKLRVDLAWAYLCTDNDVDGPIQADKALALDPELGDAHAVRGLALLAQKKSKPAAESLSKALEMGTRFRFRSHEALGRIALQAGDKAEAVSRFEEAKRISPRAGAGYPRQGNLYYLLAKLYNEAGDEEKAIACLEELRAFAVEDDRCREELAKHYLRQNDEEGARKALEVLEELVYINPFDRKLHDRIAQCAEKLSRHEVVVRQWKLLLKYPDTNPLLAYTALAKASLALGRNAEAAEFARKVLEIDPEHKDAAEVIEKAAAKKF
jgi:tetratricopeptide (TPR) repeat protein